MKHNWKVRSAILGGSLAGIIALPSFAVEIITQEDLVNGVIKTEQLIKVADNAVLLFDNSNSMDGDFAGTGTSKIQAVKAEMKRRNSFFPDLGHNIGIFSYAPEWKVHLPMQLYNRDQVAAALDTLPEKGSGSTPLLWGLEKATNIIKKLPGKTALFVFSDGTYTGGNPSGAAQRLVAKYDVCFYVISTAEPEREHTLEADVASLNSCSRMIPLADFINRPEYTSGALFDVRVTENVVTTTDTKIVGVNVDNMNFAFDEDALTDKDMAELDSLAAFMKGHPTSYIKIAGYTDNAGSDDYNVGLSRSRAEMVASYLNVRGGIDSSRMAVFWYGSNNPIVPNDTPENRAMNRRVEVNVGGL